MISSIFQRLMRSNTNLNKKLVDHGVLVDFMQTVNWLLSTQFSWSKTPSGGVRAHLS